MMNVTEAILLIYGDHLSSKTFNVFPNEKRKYIFKNEKEKKKLNLACSHASSSERLYL